MTRSARGTVKSQTQPSRSNWYSLKRGDFTIALSAPVLAKSPHFVLHHVAASPASAIWRPRGQLAMELSTAGAPNETSSVDNVEAAGRWWLGLVVPKRHAKHSVTRNLLKRQMRVQADGHRSALPPGQWVIRLRAPFDARGFPSAASTKLREAARSELERVFAGALAA
jgi:ribonuclease P protein component